MKYILFAVLIFSSLSFTFVATGSADELSKLQDCLSKTCFVKLKKVGQSDLPLLGAKLFKYYFWTAYSIALYGPSQARGIDLILADVPKRLVLVYKRDFEAEDIIKAADKMLRKNPDVDQNKIQNQLDQINKLYVSIKEGESYALEYEPGKGTTLLKNDVALGTVAGAEFAKAYFGIWLSKYPIDESLRDQLLGIE